MSEKVYIASPYTNGDQEENVLRQIDAADVLMNYGYIPFVPLLSHYQHVVHHRSYKDWLNLDFVWLKTCDFMVRIRPLDESGIEITSGGADLEEAEAMRNDIPVISFETIDDLDKYMKVLESIRVNDLMGQR